MANWITIPTRMIRKEDLDRNEDLNIDIEPETIFGPMTIDADKITGYSALYTEEAEASTQQSEIILDSGLWMTVNLPIEKLDALIRKTKKKTNE